MEPGSVWLPLLITFSISFNHTQFMAKINDTQQNIVFIISSINRVVIEEALEGDRE